MLQNCHKTFPWVSICWQINKLSLSTEFHMMKVVTWMDRCLAAFKVGNALYWSHCSQSQRSGKTIKCVMRTSRKTMLKVQLPRGLLHCITIAHDRRVIPISYFPMLFIMYAAHELGTPVLHYALPLVFTLALNTHAIAYPVIWKNSPEKHFAITPLHAISLSLNNINLATGIWEKIHCNKRTVNLCHSQRDKKTTGVLYQYLNMNLFRCFS
jgi:hypothetical protein